MYLIFLSHGALEPTELQEPPNSTPIDDMDMTTTEPTTVPTTKDPHKTQIPHKPLSQVQYTIYAGEQFHFQS